MSSRRRAATVVLASISVFALVAEATAASAQPYDQSPPPGYDQGQQQGYDQSQQPGYDQPQPDYNQGPPQGYNQPPPDYNQGYNQGPPPSNYPNPAPGYGQYGPPQGQYAPQPYAPQPYGQPGYGQQGPGYDNRTQQYDQDYASRYSAWAAQYCVDRRNNNTVAGAVIGGVLGALVGSGVAGHHERGEGAVVGGVLGAGAGAAIGSSSGGSSECPPGYVMADGAPTFAYGGPYVGVTLGSAPGWYHPWYQVGGRWYYRPYRRYYYEQHGWRGRDDRRWRDR